MQQTPAKAGQRLSVINIRKAVTILLVVGWAQILVCALAALLFFAHNRMATTFLLCLLLVLILFTNYIVMRRALAYLNAERALAEMEATLDSANDLNRKLRAQRHDFMNHLQVVYSLLELGENQEALSYMDRVYRDIQSVSKLLRTDNAAVNALLSAKAMDAEHRQVKMEFDIRSRVSNLPMEPWEFCGILGNIIDNAMDALEGADNPCVRVLLWEELGSFNFAVENNGPAIAEGIINRIFEPGFTTKGDNGQGLGLHIVQETLAQYGGAVQAVHNGAWTRFTGSVPLSSVAHA